MYTLIGLDLGPTSVAFVTDHIYRDPNSVGLSIVTVSLPVSIISAALLWRARGPYRRTRAFIAEAAAGPGRLSDEPTPVLVVRTTAGRPEGSS